MRKKTILGYKIENKSRDLNLENQFISINKLNSTISSILSSVKELNVNNVFSFLNPKIKDLLPDPFIFSDIKKGIELIYQAIKDKKKIGILSDYDVDGVTSCSILKIFLEWIDIEVEIIIPDRFKDGYGPSIGLVEKAKKLKIELLITLDCGTVAFEPIEYAKNNGIEVIVIDHHIAYGEKPSGVPVINPNHEYDKSGFNYLCAAGMTFIFCVGLNRFLREIEYYKKIQEPNVMNLLHLVAIGSVCDVMKMVGLNRAFYRSGIEILNKNINEFEKLSERDKIAFVGIKNLINIAGLKKIESTYHLGFVIGPMINAGGRIENGMIGVDLLTTKDEKKAQELSIKLKELNEERKEIQNSIYESALKTGSEMLSDKRNLIFIKSKDWHEGVIGIVASRVKEELQKPVIIGSVLKNNGIDTIKASCRSIDGVNIGDFVLELVNCGLAIKGGGHAAAAGFTCRLDKYDEICKKGEIELSDEIKLRNENKKILISAEVLLNQINENLANELANLEPFGIENEKPIFLIKDVIITSYRILKEKHYKLKLKSKLFINGESLEIWKDAIIFNANGSDLGNAIINNIGLKISAICTIDKSDYSGYSIIFLDIIV